MHLHKGKEYFEHNQLQKAREELEAAYHLRPQDEKALNMLGMTYFKLEMLPQAEEMYVILASNNPEIYTLHINLGLIRLKLDKLEQANEALNRALELQPGNSKAHFYLGLLSEKKEQWQEALYHFEQAKAEKMLAKIRAIIEARRKEQEALMPFEVVQVLSDLAEQPEESVTAVVGGQEPFVAARESEMEATVQISPPDLASIVQPVLQEPQPSQEPMAEPFAESPPSAAEAKWTAWDEDAQNVKLTEILESMRGQEQSETEEEELIEDLSPEDVTDETSMEEIKPWEKTKPGLIPEDYVQPEVIQQMESSFFTSTSPGPEEPFFMGEEIAADISTFLAQSRGEQEEEEDIFPLESPFSAQISGDASVTQEVSPSGFDPAEIRIPTPEEVENEMPVAEQFAPDVTPVSPIADLSQEEHPEEQESFESEKASSIDTEFIPEIQAELEQHMTELPDEKQWSEEVLPEDNSMEAPEEQTGTTEGHLQQSPLTPDEEEPAMEETQSMTVLSQASKMKSSAVTWQELPHETPAQPEPPAGSAVPAAVFQPVNLDQFSRDRFYIQPLIGADRYLLIDPHLLEVILSDRLTCRQGTISSYTGALGFEPWKDERIPLLDVQGAGVLFLADRRKEIFLLSLNTEEIFVETNHLLVAQSSLKVEPYIFEQQENGAALSVLKISGRGTVALTCQTKPLTLNVHENLPANIPSHAVIAWSGNLHSQILEDPALRKVLMAPGDDAMFLHFTGSGDVVVEQGGLWGDRKGKR